MAGGTAVVGEERTAKRHSLWVPSSGATPLPKRLGPYVHRHEGAGPAATAQSVQVLLVREVRGLRVPPSGRDGRPLV